METMTANRIYVTLSPKGDPKFISYYDRNNKRRKQVDWDKPHQGVSPHTHHGYNHNEDDPSKGFTKPTVEEQKMLERVTTIWKEKKDVVWTRWRNRLQNNLGAICKLSKMG